MSLSFHVSRPVVTPKFGRTATNPPVSSTTTASPFSPTEMQGDVLEMAAALKQQRMAAKTPEAKAAFVTQLNARADMVKGMPADVAVREGRHMLQSVYGADKLALVEEFLQGKPKKAVDLAQEHGPKWFKIADTIKQQYRDKPAVAFSAQRLQQELVRLFVTIPMASNVAQKEGPGVLQKVKASLQQLLPQLDKQLQKEAEKAPAAEKPMIAGQQKLLHAMAEKSGLVIDALSKHLWKRVG